MKNAGNPLIRAPLASLRSELTLFLVIAGFMLLVLVTDVGREDFSPALRLAIGVTVGSCLLVWVAAFALGYWRRYRRSFWNRSQLAHDWATALTRNGAQAGVRRGLVLAREKGLRGEQYLIYRQVAQEAQLWWTEPVEDSREPKPGELVKLSSKDGRELPPVAFATDDQPSDSPAEESSPVVVWSDNLILFILGVVYVALWPVFYVLVGSVVLYAILNAVALVGSLLATAHLKVGKQRASIRALVAYFLWISVGFSILLLGKRLVNTIF